MTELRKLEHKQEPVPAVVGALEQLLTKAKAGHLRRIVVAAVANYPADPNCTVVCPAGDDAPIALLVVALERCKLRALGFVEDCDVVPEALNR